ncbi:hypothetical protein C9374_014074 [Naegleria lovaniensis]|uniref:NADAR domain-containing protein n=1 Tax=Naegleria lovaniensis TaxID=51637 RepID=A0AA88KPU6_NAELO|nr:uncharacterized protein C9374_014074 [Naegleria lovaniensis]KAG2389514.1 hypothetical protein C9374_014074 [Naegleria lovaniensis]
MEARKFWFFCDDDLLTQWLIAPFKVQMGDDIITFNCSEQYMMYRKAKLFGDDETATLILQTNNPSQQKELGRKAKGFNAELWDSHKEKIVFEGNYHKFEQNQDLREKLFQLGNVEFVETNPDDSVWGIGLSMNDERIHDKSQWKGLNLLGKILTQVRDELLKKLEKSSTQ